MRGTNKGLIKDHVVQKRKKKPGKFPGMNLAVLYGTDI